MMQVLVIGSHVVWRHVLFPRNAFLPTTLVLVGDQTTLVFVIPHIRYHKFKIPYMSNGKYRHANFLEKPVERAT
jgi:hypothetical protein